MLTQIGNYLMYVGMMIVLLYRNHTLLKIMATSALQVIKFCYHTLVASLPLEDINFLAVLEKHNLLGDAKSSVESMPTREERASYFLDNLMKQELEKNNVTGFYNLITIMANSKSDSLTKLAADISSAVKVKHEVITNRSKFSCCYT